MEPRVRHCPHPGMTAEGLTPQRENHRGHRAHREECVGGLLGRVCVHSGGQCVRIPRMAQRARRIWARSIDGVRLVEAFLCTKVVTDFRFDSIGRMNCSFFAPSRLCVRSFDVLPPRDGGVSALWSLCPLWFFPYAAIIRQAFPSCDVLWQLSDLQKPPAET